MTFLVFLAAFVSYLACAHPAIAPRDAADMAAAAYTLTPSHAPGYPLYAVLGRAWLAAFPLGGEAYRLSVLSALAGAGAVACAFVLGRRRGGAWSGLAAAAALALSAPLWKFSLLQEKYALHALFGLSLLVLAEGGREDAFRRARLSGLLLGLGLVNHPSLLFWLPALGWAWTREARRHGASAVRVALAAAAPLAAGLALEAFLWVRLGGLSVAWRCLTRSQYGTADLFAGYARPWSLPLAGSLLSYSVRGIVEAVSAPGALVAVLGAGALFREDRPRLVVVSLLAAATPAFVLVTRFELSDWVVRSVLEPAFLPAAAACALLAGEAVGRFGRSFPAWGAAAALAIAAGAASRRPIAHRDDFLAHDYVLDLRRALPAGSTALVAGDTALFGLRWLDLTRPAGVRDVAGARLVDSRAWLQARRGRSDAFAVGLPPGEFEAAGYGKASPVSPEGLVVRLSSSESAPAPMVLRRSASWDRWESYARDARLSRAFAAWSAARLIETQGGAPPPDLDLTAVLLDPEDYSLD